MRTSAIIFALFIATAFAVNINNEAKVLEAEQQSYNSSLVYAVTAGYRVSWSSYYGPAYVNPRLNMDPTPGANEKIAGCWTAGKTDTNQWIQVTSDLPRLWTGVITQGRGVDSLCPSDCQQFVSAYTVSVSDDGVNFVPVDGGRTFTGNDRNSKAQVQNDFNSPVVGRILRINPTSWNNYISMKFDAMFLKQ